MSSFCGLGIFPSHQSAVQQLMIVADCHSNADIPTERVDSRIAEDGDSIAS